MGAADVQDPHGRRAGRRLRMAVQVPERAGGAPRRAGGAGTFYESSARRTAAGTSV